MIALHADNKTLASASADHTVKLWNLVNVQDEANATEAKTAKNFTIELEHEKAVNTVVYSSKKDTCATGADDGFICIWDLRDGQQMFKLEGGMEPILCLAFDARAEHLAAGQLDGSIRIWCACKP